MGNYKRSQPNSLEPIEEMEAIGDALKIAAKTGEEIELIWTAMRYMQSNPGMPVIDAFNAAMSELNIQ